MDVPVRLTVAPAPPVIVPDILHVAAWAVKLIPETLAPLTVTARFVGVNANPDLLGVTV